MTMQWKKEQVLAFFGCCTADSQTDTGRHQLNNNGSLVIFYTACRKYKKCQISRLGRTASTCDEMQCDLVDAQLRAVGDYLDGFDDFFLSLPGIILGAFSTIGK